MKRRYSASRRASSSAASSGSSSSRSTSSPAKRARAFSSSSARDQHEELTARLEVQLVALGQLLDEGEHDAGDVDVRQRDLLLEDERQQQVEGAFERLEVELELVHGHAREASGGLGRGGWESAIFGPVGSIGARPPVLLAAPCG